MTDSRLHLAATPDFIVRDLMANAASEVSAAIARSLNMVDDADAKHRIALAASSAAIGFAAGTHWLTKPETPRDVKPNVLAVLAQLREDCINGRPTVRPPAGKATQ